MKFMRRERNGCASLTWERHLALAITATALMALAGCQHSQDPTPGIFSDISQTTQHGYVVSPEALAQIPPGSSREQVLIALGSPSTTGTFGNEVFYYISQTRRRDAKFMPDKVINQHVVAVYFDNKQKVARVANYGLKDGKIFDFVSQTTPTGGIDRSFLQQVFAGLIGFNPSPIPH